MEFTAQQIAQYLKGEIVGNPGAIVRTISKIEEGIPNSISFLANPKYAAYIYTTESSIVLVNADFVPERPLTTTLIKVHNAYEAFAALLDMYQSQKKQPEGIDSLAFVDASCTIGKQAYIGAFAYIGRSCILGDHVRIYPQVYIGDHVHIGNNVVLYPGAKIYDDCIIGNNCIIHAGSVIGSDGFGFAPQSDNNYKKVPQIGNVVLEDNVEIGANTTIDRATVGTTLIKSGVKLDNLIQVAHNVEIGENTVIAAQTGISGSTKLGKNGMIGGQVGFSGHLKMGDNLRIGAQAGINFNAEDDAILQGTPAMPLRDFQKSTVIFRKLPEMYKQILQLEKKIEELEKKLNTKD